MFGRNKKNKKPPTGSPKGVAASTKPSSPTKTEIAPSPVKSYATATNNDTNGNFQLKVSIDEDAFKEASSFIGAIDQGTSSSRFVVVSQQGRIVASAQLEIHQYFPQPGWHEHNPVELWESVCQCVTAVSEAVSSKSFELQAIGITNQRETTLAWNRATGKPYYNAIVWDDLRTTEIAKSLRQQQQKVVGNDGICQVTRQTGLPIASYFSGTKIRWLVENVPELAKDLQERPDQVCFGTVDVWLAFQLTGQAAAGANDNGSPSSSLLSGGLFVTDATNASRWMFMDLMSQTWDQQLIETVVAHETIKVPISALPEIHSSSHVYGQCSELASIPKLLHKVPLAAILGDQQAALFGQTCFEPGDAKNTYGTGLFLMMVTGDKPMTSTHGLLTTIGYKIGGKTTYALEGSVAHSGSTIQWLRDQLQIIHKPAETETLAKPQNDGVYFVPAFAGLFAPYWRPDARACIVGMTSSHDKGHVCRATLEAIAYQTKDVFDAIEKDSQVSLKSLRVDGGGTANNLLMQFQADIINVPVECPVVLETTAMGAAFAAGLAVGVWKDLDELKTLWSVAKTFEPNMSEQLRFENIRGWKKAVSKSLGWVDEPAPRQSLERVESAIVEAEYQDAYSDATDLDKAIVLAQNGEMIGATGVENSKALNQSNNKRSLGSMASSILSHALLAVAAAGLGYLLGERKPGMLSRERFRLSTTRYSKSSM